jgi:hypothetical protein
MPESCFHSSTRSMRDISTLGQVAKKPRLHVKLYQAATGSGVSFETTGSESPLFSLVFSAASVSFETRYTDEPCANLAQGNLGAPAITERSERLHDG